jgi:hypothetical protein
MREGGGELGEGVGGECVFFSTGKGKRRPKGCVAQFERRVCVFVASLR